MDNELSLNDRIAIAQSEFHCAEGATNKRVKWRTWSELVRRKQLRDHVAHGVESMES